MEAGRRGFSLDEDARKVAASFCAEAKEDPETGNGRFCRNMVENAILGYASRVYGDCNRGGSPENDFILRAEDFASIAVIKSRKTIHIGFGG